MASVLVPLADGCEELEAVTVIDLLRRADIEVTTAGLDDAPVRASRGVTLIPDETLDAALERDYDMVVLPGGLGGAQRLGADTRVGALLERMADSEKFTAAICAAPGALEQRGLLQGRRATAFPGALQVTADAGEPVVVDGKLVTSQGPGTAIDFALTLIEQLAGAERAAEVEARLQRPAAHRRSGRQANAGAG